MDNGVERGRPRGCKTTEEKGEIVGKTRTDVKATAGNSLLALLHRGPMLLSQKKWYDTD
jgi:hypothetical protein